jgi:thiamine kinase-like enzyme
VARIGIDYGLSGRIHRVVAETTRGASISFVVKQDGAVEVERELLFRTESGDAVRGSVAECFGGASDGETGHGALVLEDIYLAVQGDVLRGCTDAQAAAVIRALSRVHAATWHSREDAFRPGMPRWRPAPMEPRRWNDAIRRAHERFPEILTSNIAAGIGDLPDQVANSVERLAQGSVSWIQVDAHLDNVLWRPDGTAVLLDWSSAAIGPPSVDLARFVAEGVVRASEPERLVALLSTYVEELKARGVVRVRLTDLRSTMALALRPLLQGAVGWAGREDLEVKGRAGSLCENLLQSVCDWSRASGVSS